MLVAGTLEHLDFTENNLTIRAIYALRPVLKTVKKFKVLSTLILDQNELHDDGVKELANCLTDRFQALNSDGYSSTLWMPLTHISISDV